jgi:dihydrofolate reductase
MRKLIVGHMISIDGFYEGKDRSLAALFDYRHDDYANDDKYDHYNVERLRAADTLLLSGRMALVGNRDYWTSVLNDPGYTAIRKEFARLITDVEKVVVSDTLTSEELGAWTNTRIVKRADAPAAVAALKAQPGKGIAMFAGRLLRDELLMHDLVDELHIAVNPLIGFEGTPLFTRQPGVSLKLIGTRTWEDSGIVVLCYAVSRKAS